MSTNTAPKPPDAALARREAIAQDSAIAFGESGIEIKSLADAARFAQWAIDSRIVKLNRIAEVVIAMQTGMELGFSPMQSLQVVHVIEGRPSLAVEAQAAKVESDGALEPGTKILYRFEGEGENLACIAWSHPQGGERIESEPVYLHEFKHLRTRDNWKNYPKRMLKARAVGWHVRDYYARSIRNLPTAEELRDLQTMRGEAPVSERDVTPPKGPDPLLAQEPDVPEPEDAQILDPDCAHPDGFAASDDNPDPHCVHCGVVEPGEAEQGDLIP